MVRLIDADELGVGRCNGDVLPADYCAGWNGLIGLLEKAPTVDAVPVVRCKDCAHLYGSMCAACGLLPRKPDDFCSCGERKDGTDSDTDGSI